MKLSVDQRLPIEYSRGVFAEIMRLLQNQINALSEGVLVAHYSATTAAPTTGTYAQGDFIRNSAPTESGTAGSKYVIHGWQCVASGTPGTWVQCRFLTGN